MDRREFMDQLGRQIRYKKAVSFVAKEIEDPVEIGVAMDRIHRPKMNWRMIAFIGILNIAGLWMQYSVEDMMPFSVIPVKNIS